MKRLYNRIFNKWRMSIIIFIAIFHFFFKWQLIKENQFRTKIVSNPILGYLSEDDVCVNTYLKTNIYTGKTKSKFVEI